MRAGLSSYTYTWAVGVPGYSPARPLTLVQLLERAASLSVSVVQIADNLPLHADQRLTLRCSRPGARASDFR